MLFLTTNIMAQLPATFTLKARNAEYGIANGVAVGPDGTVFLANSSEGMFDYEYSVSVGIDDNSFQVNINYSKTIPILLTQVRK